MKLLSGARLTGVVAFFGLATLLVGTVHGESVPSGLLGDWSLDLSTAEPAWMRVEEQAGNPVVSLRIYVGSAGPYRDVEVSDGRVQFEIVKKSKGKRVSTTRVSVGLVNGELDGAMVRTRANREPERVTFTGTKISAMPADRPDLSKVRFGQPISLFNGKDMTGWTTHEPDKKNGWSVVDGVLQNNTPKTDFSATGDHANLKTEASFEDFWLHLEFLVGSQRNSGVYLRGMYEAQVVDRDSRMQGIQGVGAIFGEIPPSKNAGRAGGEWQTYDITLVDRHVTVVLNGEKVIDNQPISRPTAGAIHTNPDEPGPIYLQGDHTNVSYRNLYLAPVVQP
ncbi:glycosyl hydrolase [Rhodopirellula islandica]|uniref:Glycosyl hydrolase n=1 Tax=Rhodopirellula islandica TaxID=595434 RepID=A0A0J1EI42_RHOIS|nr:DUF1080 domain-containing protein [Rhodopirellula islandica]KLU05214.1 glycosyl hydrolase [Rhodopirellula islandica]